MARQLELVVTARTEQADQALRATESRLQGVQQAASRTGQTVDQLADAADKRLASKFKVAEKATNDFVKEVDKLGRSSEQVASPTRGVGMLSSALTRLASGLALGAVIGKTIDYADKLKDLSDMTGIAAGTLARFDRAARTNGSSIDELARTFATLQDRVGGGDRSVVRAFDRLGISLESFRRLNPEQQVLTLARSLSTLTDQNELATVSNDLFGRSGLRTAATMREIASSFESLRAPTTEHILQVAEVKDRWEDLKVAGMGLVVDAFAHFQNFGRWAQDWTPDWLEKLDRMFRLTTVQAAVQERWNSGVKAAADHWRTLFDAVNPFFEKFGMSFGAGPLPNPRRGTDIELPVPTTAGFDPAETLRIEREITTQLGQQVGLRGGNAGKVRETTVALEQQLAVMDRQLQRVANISTFFGYRPSNFAWEDMPGWVPPVPGNPSGPAGNGANQLLGMDIWGNPTPGRPTDPRRHFFWQNIGDQQAGWRAANFGSAAGWTSSAIGWGSGLQDVMENGDPLVNATNVRGRGRRALAGAVAGAEIGGRFGGPYGAMGGAVVGLIVGAFRNPAFEDVWNRIARNFGTVVSDELAQRIADRARDEFGGSREAAEIRSLSDIIGEGGLNADNIDEMTARLRDAFSMFETGRFNADQLRDTLDESFGYFAEYYENVGGLADASFLEIIELQRRFGVESEAVTAHVTRQAELALGGLERFLGAQTIRSSEAATGLMGAAVSVFNQIRQGPEGLRGAVEAMTPVIASIGEQLETVGIEASVAFFDMQSLVGSMTNEDFAAAVEAVDGLNQVLLGLHNGALLNQETFEGLAHAVADTYNELVAQGHDGDHALRLMQPTLQTIWELQRNFGYEVDETTQAMLDQAEQQGYIGEKFQDVNRQMLDALGMLNDTLSDIRDHFLGMGSDAERAANDIETAFNRADPRVYVRYEYEEAPPGMGGGGDYAARGGYVTARGVRYLAWGGFVPRGSDTVPAMLTPGEGVLSKRGMAALGRLNRGEGLGGQTFHITINANDRSGGQDAADAFVDRLRQRGVKLQAA